MDQLHPDEQQQHPHPEVSNAVHEAGAGLNLRELNREPLTRSAVVAECRKVEGDPDAVEFSFSSEQPVERFFGTEVLDHSPGAMNMERLNSRAAPWLWNHNPDIVLGGVEKAWQGKDGRGYTRTRWSPNTKLEGSEEWKVRQNWEAGIINTVSFMYSIDAPIDYQSREGVALVTNYTVYEVSTVSIPADASVGNGRAIAASDQAKAPAAATPTPSPIPMEDITPNLEEVRAAAAAEERKRVASITATTREHGCEALAQKLIEDGATVEVAQREVLAELAKRSRQPQQHATPAASASAQAQPIAGSADIGLTDQEARSFSFLRAMRAQLLSNERSVVEAAAFEREVSNATAKRMGMAPKGLLVPNEVLSRSLVAGTASGAGDLIFTDARPESFIELLRKRNVLTSLGVTVLAGLSGPVAFPKQTGAAQAYWVGEQGEATESEPAVGQVNMSLKTLSAWTRFSRSLMLQSSLDVEMWVRNELATVMALEQARAMLYGSGTSNEPQGLKNITGINTEDFGAAQPTYAELVSMETKINADDADVGAFGYVTGSTIYGGFKTTEKASNTAQFVLEPGNTVNSYPVVRSNQVESGDVFLGIWNQVILGLWGALDLQVNPYSEDKAGNVRVVVHQSCDVAVRYPEAFCRGNNTL